MNKIFSKPKKYDLRLKEKNLKINLMQFKDKLFGYKWENTSPTIQLMGRFQPWHYGHRKLFEKCDIKNWTSKYHGKKCKKNKTILIHSLQ